jgi:hypothetical protein
METTTTPNPGTGTIAKPVAARFVGTTFATSAGTVPAAVKAPVALPTVTRIVGDAANVWHMNIMDQSRKASRLAKQTGIVIVLIHAQWRTILAHSPSGKYAEFATEAELLEVCAAKGRHTIHIYDGVEIVLRERVTS